LKKVNTAKSKETIAPKIV